MGNAVYKIGDVFDRLAELPDGSIDLVLTSPPFLALRSYLPADHPDKAKEIGSEPTPAAFLDTLLALTAEWRRVLAPHGSICVELGDTYAGSGGAGGDYAEGGLREGAPAFEGSARAENRKPKTMSRRLLGGDPAVATAAAPPDRLRTRRQLPGWPLDKSLCGIPHLYHLSLAYGRNLLTGEESPAGQWRVRNVVAWCRPNPPVGALADKFRPATSYMTIATVARDRYFDLDAVRTRPKEGEPGEMLAENARRKDKRDGGGSHHGVMADIVASNPAGAPPLDWWEIPTQPYSGSHYATWPEALCARPIKAMCPARVCRVCGKPSKRITSTEQQDTGRTTNGPKAVGHDDPEHMRRHYTTRTVAASTTLGWTDCGCSDNGTHWRNGIVLDCFGGSGTTLAVAVGHGRDAIGFDLDARNADLARERVGMFLEIDDNPRPVVDVHPSEGVA